jgi:HPt (histidine-containing phosphotransfer) domain-containing protein
MNATNQFENRLIEMKQRFVRMMPDRIAAISSTLAGYGDGGREATRTMETQFHNLAGTAGTFDLEAIAAVASEGEQACAELNQSAPDSGDFSYLAYLVDCLQGALAIDAPSIGENHV